MSTDVCRVLSGLGDQIKPALNELLKSNYFPLELGPVDAEVILHCNFCWKYCTFYQRLMKSIIMNGQSIGMAYRITDISEKPIYRLFCKYRISVSVEARISDIGYKQPICHP